MFIAIGKVVQSQGIRGYVKAVPYSGSPERFLNLKTLYVGTNNEPKGLILEDVAVRERDVLLKFKNIDNREDAAAFIQRELFLPYEQRMELSEGVFFIHDLIGLQVFDIEGNFLGEVTNVMRMGANDIYQVNNGDKEVLIPAVSEFVKGINLEDKRIIVKLIEGMVE